MNNYIVIVVAVLMICCGLYVIKKYKSLGLRTINDRENFFYNLGFRVKYNKKAMKRSQNAAFIAGLLAILLGIFILVGMFLTYVI